jgi:hypothetical protein
MSARSTSQDTDYRDDFFSAPFPKTLIFMNCDGTSSYVWVFLNVVVAVGLPNSRRRQRLLAGMRPKSGRPAGCQLIQKATVFFVARTTAG